MIKARYQKMYTEKYKQDMDFVIIGEHYIGPFVDMNTAQKAVQAINEQLSPQPKPKRTRIEHEKVTESIFDLRDEFERGELYFDKDNCTGGIYASNEQYQKIRDIRDFKQAALNNNIYRRIEKPVDWREELNEWQHAKKIGIYTPLDYTVAHLISVHPEKFLEMCRVALRANGEIE